MRTKGMNKINLLFKKYKVWWRHKIDLPFLYDYQKVLLKLSLVALVALFFVVRGSTAPLLIDTELMRQLFCTDVNGDKTIYNIAISVIAAYIFYIFQVHIPGKKKHRRNMTIVSELNKYLVRLLEELVTAWRVFLIIYNGEYGCVFKEFEYETNIGSYTVDKENYTDLVNELTDKLDEIIKLDVFDDFDTAYCDLIIKAYRSWNGFKYVLRDMTATWENQAVLISQNEYNGLLNRLESFERISKKLQQIEKYPCYLIRISKYKGKSRIRQWAEQLAED